MMKMGRPICILVVLTFGLHAMPLATDLGGTWKGFNETPTGLGALQLTFSHQGGEWSAVCKFPELDGENTFSVRELMVNGTNISFAVAVDNENRQMRFSGTVSHNKIEGTYEMWRAGQRIYIGEWAVKHSQPDARLAPQFTRESDTSATATNPPEQNGRKLRANLPSPTGNFVVGRTTFYWKDPARAETFSNDPNARRELMVTLWYPAGNVGGLALADYFPSYALINGASAAPLPASRKSHAFEQAALPRTPRSFPVVVFSHGLGENTTRYTAQLEELASHGYVVAAVDHTYDNQAVVFPDGRVARWSDKWEWAFSGDSPDRQEFIFTQLRVMVADVSFAVDQMRGLNADWSGRFNARLDLNRLGFFGHSLGGAIAPMVCQADKRFKACLNQDGLLLGQVLILDPTHGKLSRPFMFLGHTDSVTKETLQVMALTRTEYEVYDRRRQRRAYHFLDTMPVESYVVSVRGASHSSFTDNPLLSSTTSKEYIERARTLQAVRDYTRAFFDQNLMNLPASLLAGKSISYPQVAIARFGTKE